MKTTALLFLLALIPGRFFANNFEKGIRAYEHEQYSYAAKMFNEVIKVEPNDVAAYYNLGLSHMGEQRFGKAIWAFEKVLAVHPSDEDTKEKIEYCALELNLESPWQHRINGIDTTIYSLSSSQWATLSIVLSIIIACALIGFNIITQVSLKRILALGIFVSGALLILTIIAGYRTKSYFSSHEYAVVTKLGIPIYLDQKNKSNTRLPEGTLVKRLTDDSLGIVSVETMNGEEVMVKFSDISTI